jgi:uncharacterized protein (TIGR03437 family)
MKRLCVLIFCVTAGAMLRGQTFTKLADFGGANGLYPVSLIPGNDGSFYGTTSGNSGVTNAVPPFAYGSVFKLTPSGVVTTIYNFCPPTDLPPPDCPDGVQPPGIVLGRDGNFYGTTFGGNQFWSSWYGTVFKITPGGTQTNLHVFHGADGQSQGSLMQASDGNFYGTKITGGAYQSGVVFKTTPAGVTTILHDFGSTPTDGVRPISTLVEGADGNLYGTTLFGGFNNQTGPNGPFNYGTVFKITRAGAFTTLHSFGATPTDGSVPISPLVRGSDGNFYGLTQAGGANGTGSIFKITPDGTLTILHSLSGSRTEGVGGGIGALLQGIDGNLYGTANFGGDFANGTVFRLTLDGTFTVLHSFSGGAGGFYPNGIVQGLDGNLYGITAQGGTLSAGTAFRIQLTPPAFTCTNTTNPVITSVNSASGYGGFNYFTSGSWLEIKGSNLADPADPRLSAATNPGQWTATDFIGVNAPAELDGISVSINGKPAYVWYLSPGQLNVQAPQDTATSNVAITVTNCNMTSSPFTLARQALAPGLLAPANYSANGTQYLVATFASDGAYVLNTGIGAAFGLKSRPAKPGDTIVAYGIGFGDVTPTVAPGTIVQQSNTLTNPVTFSFGSTKVTPTYAGLAGGFVGLYEFFITVPARLADGDYQIQVEQGGARLPQTVYLTVHG